MFFREEIDPVSVLVAKEVLKIRKESTKEDY